MIDDDLRFYDDGIERIVVGDPFGPTQVPSLGVGLHVKSKVPIHVTLGVHEYTGEDIRLWAKGVPSYPAWHKALLIEYLSQIIVSQVLDKEPTA